MSSNKPTMVFKKLVYFISNLRGQLQIKEALSNGVIGAYTDLEKVNGDVSDSPAPVGLEHAGEIHGGGDQVCCVCLSRVKEGQEKRVLPCAHGFHRSCVERWFNACRKTCPVCRFSMGDEEKFQKLEELTEEMVIWFSSFHVAGF